MKKHLLLFKTLIIACLAMVAGGGISVAAEAATLPVSFDGKKGDLPTGFTQSGLGSDYGSAPYLKFNDAGDYLILQIDSDPGVFSCSLKQNGSATSLQFDIQYSTDGTNYTTFKTITRIGNSKSEKISYDFSSLSGVRYIKWIYTTKGSSTNIALGSISVAKKTTIDPSSNITFSQNTGEILIGKTLDISKFVSTADGYTGTVTYSLKSGEGIASVSNQGIITGIKKGTAVITATAPGIDGSFAQSEADFTVTVVDNRISTTTTFGGDVDNQTFKVLVGQESSFTSPTATLTDASGNAIEGASLEYSISENPFATIDHETGLVSFITNPELGRATVTASYAEDENYSASSASYTISYTDGSIVFDSNNNAFENVKTDGYNSNNDNPGPTLVDQNGDEYTFTFYNSYRNNGGIQMKASSGKVTSPELDMPYGYTVKVTTNTNNVNIKIGEQTATGSNKTVELSTTEANQRFTIYTGSSYAVVTKIEIIPTNKYDIVYRFSENDETTHVGAVSDAKVAIERTLSNEYWNTLCLPFSLSAEQITATFGEGTIITEFEDVNAEGTVMTFKEATRIEASKPYLFKPAKTVKNPVFEGVTITSKGAGSVTARTNGNYAFIGTYSKYKMATDKSEVFITTSGKLSYPAEGTNTIKGMRAFIQLPITVNAKAFNLNIGGEATSIDTIDGGLFNGNATIYNLNGQKMSSDINGLAKGLYIVNGKKMIVK